MAKDRDIDDLAAEYVLGALTTDESFAVARRRETDPRLAAAITEWEGRLAPMGLRVQEVEPSPEMLGRILAKIAQSAVDVGRPGNVVVLQRRLRRSRWLAGSLAASVGALATGVAMLWPGQHWSGPAIRTAVLAEDLGRASADEQARTSSPIFVVEHDRRKRLLSVRQVAGRQPAVGRTYVIWIESTRSAQPVAIGPLTPGVGTTRLDLDGREFGGETLRLVVSHEQAGLLIWDRPRGPLISGGTFEPN